jgi:hypothetical protein
MITNHRFFAVIKINNHRKSCRSVIRRHEIKRATKLQESKILTKTVEY